MGTALITIKIMPDSPKANLNTIKEKAEKIAKEKKGKNITLKIEPIAFGLNALIINFALDESLSIDNIQEELKKIEQVSSAEVTDFRRAFG